MINQIIDAMCRILREEFGNDYGIYTEKLTNGIKEPCFFLSLLKPEDKNDITGRRKWNHIIAIQYFAGGEEPKAECNNVYERMRILELLNVSGNRIRGELECKDITDGVMTVSVAYRGFYLNTEMEEKMDELTWKGATRNGG